MQGYCLGSTFWTGKGDWLQCNPTELVPLAEVVVFLYWKWDEFNILNIELK